MTRVRVLLLAVELYVEQSATMLRFLSRGYLQSYNCLREVRETLKHKKP